MPIFQLSPGVEMFYRDDTFADPWQSPDAMLMLHGNGENGTAWNRWMPAVGRRFRVLRPDMRGFGKSTPMPIEHPWSVDEIVDDFSRLCDRLEIARFHLVAAKVGGAIAAHFAATRPDRVRTLTLLGARVNGGESPNGRPEAIALIEREGVAAWARNTMAGRMGRDCPPETVEGWIALMGATAASTQLGFFPRVSSVDVSAELARITAPTLVVTSEGNRYNRSGMNGLEETRSWQQRLRDSELLVLPGDSFHVAVTDAEACARATLDFIDRHAAAALR